MGREQDMAELILKEEVYQIIGAAMEVYNELGSGFLESVYQEAMTMELSDRQIEFRPLVSLRIKYKGRVLRKRFCADLICFDTVLVELKTAAALTEADDAQVLNYLRATGLRVCVLINFGDPAELKWKRLVL
jgi:GxxExxY protein